MPTPPLATPSIATPSVAMPAPPLDALPAAASPTPLGGGVRPIGAYAPEAGKPRGPRLRTAWAGALLLAVVALAGCKREAPEQALRDTIAAMQAAAEARDTDALF